MATATLQKPNTQISNSVIEQRGENGTYIEGNERNEASVENNHATPSPIARDITQNLQNSLNSSREQSTTGSTTNPTNSLSGTASPRSEKTFASPFFNPTEAAKPNQIDWGNALGGAAQTEAASIDSLALQEMEENARKIKATLDEVQKFSEKYQLYVQDYAEQYQPKIEEVINEPVDTITDSKIEAEIQTGKDNSPEAQVMLAEAIQKWQKEQEAEALAEELAKAQIIEEQPVGLKINGAEGFRFDGKLSAVPIETTPEDVEVIDITEEVEYADPKGKNFFQDEGHTVYELKNLRTMDLQEDPYRKYKTPLDYVDFPLLFAVMKEQFSKVFETTTKVVNKKEGLNFIHANAETVKEIIGHEKRTESPEEQKKKLEKRKNWSTFRAQLEAGMRTFFQQQREESRARKEALGIAGLGAEEIHKALGGNRNLSAMVDSTYHDHEAAWNLQRRRQEQIEAEKARKLREIKPTTKPRIGTRSLDMNKAPEGASQLSGLNVG